MSKSARKLILPFLILIVLLVTAVLAGGTAAQPSIDNFLELDITSTGPSPVPVGQQAEFRVELRNISEQNLINLGLKVELEEALVASYQVAIDAGDSIAIKTGGIRRKGGTVSWKGGIGAGGVLVIDVKVTPAFCTGENIEISLEGEAGPIGGTQKIDAAALEDARCQGALAATDVDVDLNFTNFPYGDWTPLLAGRPAEAVLTVENKSDGRINAIIAAGFKVKDGQEANCLLLPAVQQQVSGAPTIPISSQFMGSDSFTYTAFMALEIEQTANWKVDLRLPVRGRIPGCEYESQAVVYAGPAVPIPGSCKGESPECRYAGWTPREDDVMALVDWLLEQKSEISSAVLVAPDLGDAPASVNNSETEMEAYPDVIANFPTVFNFNIGMPPSVKAASTGPFHRDARPLRLGDLVTRELDADRNPGRNIYPEENAANLDRRDDGLNFGEMPGNCQRIDLTLDMFVEPSDAYEDALMPAFINVFIDANGDGDWADSWECDGETVAEHVIINERVDLDPGQHRVDLPPIVGIMFETLNGGGTWARVTVAEAEAPTPLNTKGIAHGDGRGPAGGYLFGETEDYLIRLGNQTEAVTQGADLGVRMDANLSVYANPHMLNGPTLQATDWLTHTTMVFDHLIRVGNLGDGMAPGSKLIVLPDPALRDSEIILSVAGDLPWTYEGLNYSTKCGPGDPNCRVEIDLGNVPPGRFGSVLLSATANCEPSTGAVCKKTGLKTVALVETEGDTGGNNNRFEKNWNLPLPGEWLAPPIIDYPIPGTTSAEELVVQGVAWPDRKILVGINGKKAGEDGDKDGPWKVTVTPGEGDYQIRASYETPGGKFNPSAPVSVVMSGGSTMIIDPMSMKVGMDHNGSRIQVHPWMNNARVDAHGWQLPLEIGKEAEITVEPSSYYCLTCTVSTNEILRPLTATLTLPNGQILTTLAVSEESRLLRGSLTPTSAMVNKPVSLNVHFEGVEQVYEGFTTEIEGLPQIINGLTGQPVEGAKVVLWQAAVDGSDFNVWNRSQLVNGQPNPRVTGNDGTFLFDLKPGRYRLEIIYDENAPSVWTDMRPLFGIYPTTHVIYPQGGSANATSLTAAETTVSIGEDGFSPPVVTVSPGSRVNFVNVDLLDRGIVPAQDTLALLGLKANDLEAPAFIQPASSLPLTFYQPGTFGLEDPQDPQNKMIVIVELGSNWVYMPVTMRK